MPSYSLPRVFNYGQYSSNNYGHHTRAMEFGPVRIYYSYDTIVAFQVDGNKRVVLKNYWSTTTGKHLNWIDGGGDKKKARVDQDTFDRMFDEQVGPYLKKAA